jgi:hypothetical protein
MMKKNTLHIVFLILIILFFSKSGAISQEINKGKFNLGFEGGVQFSNAEDQRTLNPVSSKTAYSSGPYIEYFISDMISVKLGLNYDNRGFKIDDVFVGLAGTSEITDSTVFCPNSYLHITRNYSVNYLTIPLSFRYVKSSGKFKIFIEAGPYYSILINGSRKGQNDLYLEPQCAPHFEEPPGHQYEDFNGDATSLFNTYDFGMSLYLGGIVQFSPQWGITISPGFMFSFANLYSNPEIDAKWTQIFKINAGVVYTLKGNK